MTKITLFAQAIGKLPKEKIRKIIRESGTEKHCKGYDTWSQFVSIMFSQFSNCDSVRDISNGLNSANGNLNHLGIARAPSKSTIAYRNAHRNSKVFRDIYYATFQHFGQQSLWQRSKFRFKAPIKLLDSSMVSLTLSLYDWAHYTTTKGAIKMHTLLDYDTLLPEFVTISTGKCTDDKASFDIPIAPHSVAGADRGYCNFELLNDWDSKHVLFVVRHRDDLLYEPIRELDLPQHAAQNVLIDEIIELKGAKTSLKYPKRLRRIAIWNEEHEFTLQLLTNNMQLAASTVAALYKSRWQIEIFFRNLKQLLRIKSFIGTSRNAVETQIWTALTTMLLLCWLKHTARYKWGLANLVVSLRLNTFTKIDLEKWLNEPFKPPPDDNN
ncbi:IS4 family transposase [Porphyromonas gulae]|uniref:IS4 family transposase n=2 Tax=Porphyromonas gulae TaxID=111105 RepID=UPI00052C400D|nr:IS4 family transposase [Porphyromonas gulae]KGN91509.1 transposase [Porphyromonas gulae]